MLWIVDHSEKSNGVGLLTKWQPLLCACVDDLANLLDKFLKFSRLYVKNTNRLFDFCS